jgi:hypothetical protein
MTRSGNEKSWHREVINSRVERALEALRALGALQGCYLAGGTGLALRFGHRRSHDLDFFSAEGVDPEALIRMMHALAGFAVASQAPDTLHASVENIKVSFLAYPYPTLFPFERFLGVDVADPREIACMKLSAIASRGTKRDFVDFYFAAKQYGLPQTLEWFNQKYSQVNLSGVHVLKSLTYFEVADKQPMPDMLTPLYWEDVKAFLRKEAVRLSP